ncbi:MAG: hypothetical protein AABX01_02980 [Candidatus Micrarchaeota archaeon]
MPEEKPKFLLKSLKDPDRGTLYSLDGLPITIGHDKSASIRLDPLEVNQHMPAGTPKSTFLPIHLSIVKGEKGEYRIITHDKKASDLRVHLDDGSFAWPLITNTQGMQIRHGNIIAIGTDEEKGALKYKVIENAGFQGWIARWTSRKLEDGHGHHHH